ncbi:MAG: hypothetical protein OCU20_02170 [Methanophagales archaeon]|nr:hypothetical protein [Methanophagales archaeon]MCW3139807.1 hypothetical protein [Methanophagales archaeon]MCW7069955.1 hypothetical protein [Methanophagales archaeon]MCW7072695.1 hypothetical protein [Methanophagales archaeon]
MKGRSISVILVMLISLLLLASSVSVVAAVKAVIVSDVRGFNDYVPASSTLTRGSTLKVYTEMKNVNYDGFVAVKFFFVIEDPRDHVVSMEYKEVTRRDYDRGAYVVYTKKIPSWWLYGNYKLRIFAYNRLDKARVDELERMVEVTGTLKSIFNNEDEFDDLRDFFETSSDADDLDDLGALKSISDSLEEMTSIRFSVRPHVSKEEREKPITAPIATPLAMLSGTKFQVIDMWVDKFAVKPNESVKVSVTVRNAGERGTGKIALVINGEKEAETSVTLDHMESKTFHFYVTKKVPGTYKITIPGTSIIRFLYVEECSEVQPSMTMQDSSAGKISLSLLGGVNKWLWGIFTSTATGDEERLYNKKVLISSVFDITTHQISLIKILSSFIS